MPDIVSRACRSLFLDYLVEQSTLGDIQREFDAAGVPYVEPPQPSGGQRRTMVHGYYLGIDWATHEGVSKFLEVATFFMGREDTKRASFAQTMNWYLRPENNEHPLMRFLSALKPCGYEWREGRFIGLSADARLADTKTLATNLDLPHLGEHIRRIEASIEADPALAIGSAKEMVETVCKTILTKRSVPSGVTYSKDDDLNELGKKVFGVLRQLPDDIPDKAKGAKTIKTMLSNLRSVVQCTAELRNWYGNGHGREGDIKRGLSPRHARLVVGAASTLAWYLLETDRDME
ncbi:abortive infection family protein [Nguyenibacter vanlangensis]|uniref:Abortive infection family protein n=1 Tax=Nguyenibacter vanlangensis TaxID=1216886 RepID=A0ABZ3D347_9PROT